METYLDKLPLFIDTIKSMSETIIANIVFIGQEPAPTFKEQKRANLFMERLAEAGVDECSTDGYRNPIGIIRGTSKTKPPVFVVAHLDTLFDTDVDYNFTIKENFIQGAGILDNSVSVGVLASLPEIFRKLNLRFESDIVLSGPIQSMGKGNLRGIRHLVKTWATPIRGAVCVEGSELGRLNYYSYGMNRGEINCDIPDSGKWENRFRPNAILILNEVINQILQLSMPQRPRSSIIFGKISGGFKHGIIAYDAKLGFEIQSDSDKMVKKIYTDINDIVDGISHENGIDLKIQTISNLKASKLSYNHPLVKSSVAIMKKLGLQPISDPSESELSIFLSKNIPAVTIGITNGKNYHLENAKMAIDPMFKGIAQLVGIIMAIDSGVCDE